MIRNIALLGSTGSIGTNTLDVIARNRDRFKLLGIAAGENIHRLGQQIREFSPAIVAVKHQKDAETLRGEFPGTHIVHGAAGLVEVVSFPGTDTMVSAIDGTTALGATLVSIKNNQRICLANKETLVAAGELINRALDASDAELIPVDSEQSAIFQSLGANDPEFLRKVILTASGGPFFKRAPKEFNAITVKEALAHPTWSMGTKITIDSATLMNKALEIIEAAYLFRLSAGQVDVIIHPQSIVHSMVEFIDGSMVAQLSAPDMKLPILYSLSYPRRITFDHKPLDFAALKALEFHAVDTEKFTSIKMAYHALEQGKNAGAILNAANEVAVEYFLQEKISFRDIFTVVGDIFYNADLYPVNSIEDVNETIDKTKQNTHEYVKKML